MVFMMGCANQISDKNETYNALTVKASPVFPKLDAEVVKELKEVCPKDKCFKLYEWLARLLVFKKQMRVYKKEMI